MKKTKHQLKASRLICLVMALSMLFALTACGDKAPTASDTKSPTPESVEQEQVYVAETKLLTKYDAGQISYQIQKYTPEGLYLTSSEVVADNTPEGVVPEYKHQYSVWGSYVYFLDNSGNITRVENYKPMSTPENELNKPLFTSFSSLDSIYFTDDGFVTIEEAYTQYYGGYDENVQMYSDEYYMNCITETSYYIRSFDKTGNELTCAPIPVEEGIYLRAYNMQPDRAGNLVIPTDRSIMAVARDGQIAYNIDLQDDEYLDNMFKASDGGILVTVYSDTNKIYRLNEESHTLETAVDKTVTYIYNTVSGGGDYDFYFSSGTGFYGYNLAENKMEQLFNWLSCDVNSNLVTPVSVESDGTVIAYSTVYKENDECSIELTKVYKVDKASRPQKQNITMAAVGVDYETIDAIVEFNRSNPDYRIEVLDYSMYNNEDNGWEAGQTKLYTEIMAGTVPDIICLSGLNYRQLASKGIFADLYSFMESDEEIKKSDFFPNILAAFEVNGKLYGTVSDFYINTLVGASSVVGDQMGWNYDQFYAALASMPEGCTALDEYTTIETILYTCLNMDMEKFIDWTNGKVYFDSEDFIKLLLFVNSFPREFDWDNYEYENYEERIAQGKQMLISSAIFTIEDSFYTDYTEIMGGKTTYIGYPSTSGNGNYFSTNTARYAISATSDNKEAAWGFLRMLMSKDYKYSYAMPARIDVFEAKAKEASEVKYRKDDAGNYLLDENGDKIPEVRFVRYDQNGKETELYAVPQEQIDMVRQLVESVNKLGEYDNSIFDIVKEGAAPFFEGQKSAEEVAKLIQSKVNIYVNEQR